MNRFVKSILFCSILLLFAFSKKKAPVSIFLIGDSTVADYSLDSGYIEKRYPVHGWGQVFQPFFVKDSLSQLHHLIQGEEVVVQDKARGGRSTRTFFEEGRWAAVYKALNKNDIVIIQFGHNDAAKDKPERYVNIDGYKEYLRLYINQTREKGAIPIVLTPVCRNYPWKDGKLQNVHGDYPDAAKAVATELNVPCIDLNQLSMEAFSKKGQDYVTANYFMNFEKGRYAAYPDGQKDNTHFQKAGAVAVAQLVFNALKQPATHNPSPVTHHAYDLIVAQDGSGTYKTVQEAINAVPDFRKVETTIYIKNGVYKEKLNLSASKQFIRLIGESVEKTILTFDDWAQRKNSFGEEKGTSGSASFYVYGNNFTAENITFQNSAGPVGQAVALFVAADKARFINCRMLGFQDTLYTYGYGSRQYYYKCYIEGTVDFIFGAATALFEECEIFCKKGGYITASSSPDTSAYGYVFLNSKITGDAPDGSFYLGRPWRPYAKTVFLNCHLSKVIKAEGWNNWGKESNEKTAYYAEYNSSGPGAAAGQRVGWSHQLDKNTVQHFTIDKILNHWDPRKDHP